MALSLRNMTGDALQEKGTDENAYIVNVVALLLYLMKLL